MDGTPAGERKCPDCGSNKRLTDFPGGYGTYCKPCHNERGRETRQRLYGGSRHYHLRAKYGIGAAEVQALIDEQSGICPICLKRAATQVDHDHQTGLVRGVLCLYCNAALGAFHDDPEIDRKGNCVC